jgi:hypothetical protein
MHVLCVCCGGGGRGWEVKKVRIYHIATYRIGKSRKIDVPDPLGSALDALLDPEPDPVAIKTTKIYFKNLNQTFQTGFFPTKYLCCNCYNILPIYEKAEIKF